MEKKSQRQTIKSFYVIIERNGRFEPYDVIPYFVSTYNDRKPKERPKTFEEFKEFVKGWSMYMYWGRCEYEIILSDWPNERSKEKWDIHRQIMMNHNSVTRILMDVLKK